MRKEDLIFAGILIGYGYGTFITKEEITKMGESTVTFITFFKVVVNCRSFIIF